MKKFFLKPGFEFTFSLSFIAILCLPPMLMAQAHKDMEINIVNGDTTVNGRNIKDISVTDKAEALNDINHLSNLSKPADAGRMGMHLRHRDTLGGGPGHFWLRKSDSVHNMRQPMITEDMVVRDSLGNVVVVKRSKRPQNERVYAFNNRRDDERPGVMPFRDRMPGAPMMRAERKNSQVFNYVNTDNEGIATHISFRVAEPEHEDLERITGVEGAKLDIEDLSLVPEFSTGKTVLMFKLPSKAIADVYLKDGEGKLIWNEKLNSGSFTKTFMMPLNGIYYLHIKQGSGVVVKKIVKEE